MALIDDNQKIGIGFCLLGMVCFFMGMMFLFERTLLALGNLSFLVGLCFLLGVQKTGKFFLRREKKTGSLAFFSGFLLVLFGWAFFGFIIEMYGLWKLFSAFLPNIVQSLKLVPGMNVILSLPGIRQLCDYAYDQRRLPV